MWGLGLRRTCGTRTAFSKFELKKRTNRNRTQLHCSDTLIGRAHCGALSTQTIQTAAH